MSFFLTLSDQGLWLVPSFVLDFRSRMAIRLVNCWGKASISVLLTFAQYIYCNIRLSLIETSNGTLGKHHLTKKNHKQSLTED
jgi:hypothetical protein